MSRDNARDRRLRRGRIPSALLAAVAAIALAGTGCGSSGSNAAPPQSPSVNGAVDQCLQQAKQISQPDARRTAEEACKAAKTGNAEKVKSAAKQQCLNAVNQIPNSMKQQRDAAKARCDAIK